MTKELNDKSISLDRLYTLNNEYEKKLQEMAKELNDRSMSLDEYKKN